MAGVSAPGNPSPRGPTSGSLDAGNSLRLASGDARVTRDLKFLVPATTHSHRRATEQALEAQFLDAVDAEMLAPRSLMLLLVAVGMTLRIMQKGSLNAMNGVQVVVCVALLPAMWRFPRLSGAIATLVTALLAVTISIGLSANLWQVEAVYAAGSVITDKEAIIFGQNTMMWGMNSITIFAIFKPLVRHGAVILGPANLFATWLMLQSPCVAPFAAWSPIMNFVVTMMVGYKWERTAREGVLSNWKLQEANAASVRAAARTAVERERARAAKEHNHRFEAYVGYVLHELRNPLHGVRGALAALNSKLPAADYDRLLKAMHAGVEMMCAITNDLLDLEKLRAGKFIITQGPCSVSDILSDVISTARHACRGNITCMVANDVPIRIITDATRVRQILTNGLTNAAKHGTDISVSAHATDRDVVLSVVDDGPGLGDLTEVDLFADFGGRPRRESTEAGTGTSKKHHPIGSSGLGLPISARLAKLLGGQLTVRNAVVGESIGGRASGVRFTLTIPLEPTGASTSSNAVDVMAEQKADDFYVPPDTDYHHTTSAAGTGDGLDEDGGGEEESRLCSRSPGSDASSGSERTEPRVSADHGGNSSARVRSAAGAARGAAAVSPPTRGLRVLVVDDDPFNRFIARTQLTSLGCTLVGECSDGDEVLPAIVAAQSSGGVDVVLLDVQMPRMDGRVASAAVRRAGFSMPIVAVTGNATTEDERSYLAVGMTALLAKPFSARELAACLEAVGMVAGSALRSKEA